MRYYTSGTVAASAEYTVHKRDIAMVPGLRLDDDEVKRQKKRHKARKEARKKQAGTPPSAEAAAAALPSKLPSALARDASSEEARWERVCRSAKLVASPGGAKPPGVAKSPGAAKSAGGLPSVAVAQPPDKTAPQPASTSTAAAARAVVPPTRALLEQKAAAEGGAPPAPKKEPEPAKPEKVTLDKTSARALLDRALEAFKEPANKAKLTALTAVNPPARPPPPYPPAQLRPPTHRRRCAQHRPNAPPLSLQECNEAGENAGMMRMMKLAPAVQEMMGPALKEYGYEAEELLSVAMQVQMLGTEDPTIGADVGKLMKADQGDISGLV